MVMFVRNGWYACAWPKEIALTPLGRIICGEPIVFFRDHSGNVAALEDRCPHRRLPLRSAALSPARSSAPITG